MKIEYRDAVAHITFTRPEKRNAFNATEWVALRDALQEAASRDGTRAAALHGSPRAFSAGNDITEFQRLTTTRAATNYFIDQMLPTFTALATSPLPVVAVINGLAYGGGLEIVQFCDHAIAARTARFRLPEAHIGVWATVFTAAAPYTCGPRAAKTLGLTGREITADQAHQLGLIDTLTDEEALASEAENLLLDIARGAPASLAYTKRFANAELVAHGLPAVRSALQELIQHTLPSADAREGTRAFLAKREPVFHGGPVA